jgi:tRNA threonylcarbamoyladenosine biosynthesis protein TsaB
MIVLALDSSGSGCSVALVERGGAVLAHRFQAMTRGHAEILMPMLRDAMAEACVAFARIGLIAATVGPGSFTGIRVGLAAARGLALASGLPAIGITAFEAVADAVAAEGAAVVVAIDSRRAELFIQIFADGGIVRGPPIVVAPADLVDVIPGGRLVLAGEGAPHAAAALTAAGRTALISGVAAPDARHVARVALRRRSAGGAMPPLQPLYLRAPDVTPPPGAAPR